MLVSKKSLYAIRALLELTSNFEQKPINSAEIARKQGVSSKFIEIILNELKRAGIIESKRGANGGYLLSKKPNDITILEVITYIDGPLAIVNETREDKQADYFGSDSLSKLWSDMQEIIVSGFKKKTIKALFEEEKAIRGKEVPNYII